MVYPTKHSWDSLLNPLRRFKQIIAAQLAGRVTPRNADPFSTHIPVLIGISQLRPIHRVVEFGSGWHSTGLFLDRRVFPHVTSVVSFENDAEWFANISSKHQDERLKMNLVTGEMSSAVEVSDLAGADLIFIDDSKSGDERVRTINAVCEHVGSSAYVLVHDFEYRPYQEALRLKDEFRFDALNPMCGLSARKDLPHGVLKAINRTIVNNTALIPNTDITRWIETLQKGKSLQ